MLGHVFRRKVYSQKASVSFAVSIRLSVRLSASTGAIPTWRGFPKKLQIWDFL
jgi:hypothetical protein